jgi:hypothetical protein
MPQATAPVCAPVVYNRLDKYSIFFALLQTHKFSNMDLLSLWYKYGLEPETTL